MNTNLMAALSLAVIVAFFSVLVGFVRLLTQTLTRTGDNLVNALAVTTTIRQNCDSIVGGVLTLNKNLNAAAAGLTTVVGSANQRAASLSPVPMQRSARPEPDNGPRPAARWVARNPAESKPSERPTRSLRAPGPSWPLGEPTRSVALREPRAIGAVRREFRVRGGSGGEKA